MANAYTDTTAWSNAVQAAYDLRFRYQLWAQPIFRPLADSRPIDVRTPGSTINYEILQDMTEQITPLTENVDPDSVALGNPTIKSITLTEYGNAVLLTRKLRMFSLTDVDPAVAVLLGRNARASIDTVFQNVLRGGSNLLQVLAGTLTYINNSNGSTTATTMAATDIMDADTVRFVNTQLRTNLAEPRWDSVYGCYLHPQVAHDLRAETNPAAWRTPHEYSAVGNIWAAEIGTFEGTYFIESPRCFNAVDAGTGNNTIRRFRSYFFGKEAMMEAIGEEFHPVAGPITDKMARFRPVSWYGVGGWTRFRDEALIRVETTSSVNSD